MNWIESLQEYTSSLEQQLRVLTDRLDKAEHEIEALRGQLEELANKEPEVEVELLVADEDQPLDEVLESPAEEKPVQPASQPIVELSNQEVPVQETPAQEAPVQEVSVQEKPVQEKPVQEVHEVEFRPAEEVATAQEPVFVPQAKEEAHAEPANAEKNSVSAPPISDIRKAISIGDRFLFQRELFASDGEKMNKTIDALNKMDSLDEAKAYIEKHFHWDSESQATQLFMSLLNRRFAN